LLGSQIPEGSTESTPEEQHQAMKRLQILRGFQERMEDVTAEIDLAWLRACLLKIEGLEIDGEPAVVDTFVELGPIELYREAVQLVKSEADPTEEETNLEAVNL